MKRLALIILALSATACSQNVDFVKIESAMTPYINEFTTLMHREMPGEYVPYVGAAFTDLTQQSGEPLAQCRFVGRTRTIYVDKAAWSALCESQKRAVIFHELGHCVLGRMHNDKLLSYMNAQVNDCIYYDLNQDALDRELFTFP